MVSEVISPNLIEERFHTKAAFSKLLVLKETDLFGLLASILYESQDRGIFLDPLLDKETDRPKEKIRRKATFPLSNEEKEIEDRRKTYDKVV